MCGLIFSRWTISSAFALFVCLALPREATSQTVCPAQPTVAISHTGPDDVCIPAGFGGLPIVYFDDFSWRAFIAMVWPADVAQRGKPDTSKKIGEGSGPLVFETFKSDWELFNELGVAPKPWDDFSSPNPCKIQGLTANDLVLASFSKFGNLGLAGFGDLVGTLIAQNRTYVRYATGFNRITYDKIVSDKLYIRANQKNVVFADGAITIKAAWIDMTKVPQPERYYTREVWLMDPATANCTKQRVGLVGLHIVQKTKSRPQWIWVTFEHVDNVPPGRGRPLSLNDGTGQPMPAGPTPFPPTIPTPPPYNVQRLTPIHPDTAPTNRAYQAALQGTVWQNYQLVMTQWPVATPPTAPTVDPAQPGIPRHTFPGVGATSAFANTALETFDQTRITRGCMNCHNSVRTSTDFIWALEVHGFLQEKRMLPSSDRSRDTLSPALRALRSLMESK